MRFWRKRKPAPARPPAHDPFAAIPMKPDNVELKRDSRGMIHLRLHPEVKGFNKRVAHLLGYDYTKKIELDEYGTLYYGLVDGANTLRRIADAMVDQLGRSREEVERGVIVFTKTLMTKNLILLRVPRDAAGRTA